MFTIIRNRYLVAAALLLGATGAAQASPSAVLEANVPFAFVVNGQTMPAGKYTVERDATSYSVVLIRGEHKNHAVVLADTRPNAASDPAGARPALTFKRDGDHYRLTGIWQSQHDGWDVTSR